MPLVMYLILSQAMGLQCASSHDYVTSNNNRRYSVLCLLHSGADHADDWMTRGGTAQQTLNNLPLITVMPNGDPFR
jgi:hypothetical protein